VKPHSTQATQVDPALAIFAKVVVGLTFVLILLGGHTTTSGAGMAFPDWPLSDGSLNPQGWLHNVMMRLEHGHRLTAGLVAILVSVLYGWVLAKRKSLPARAHWIALGALLGVFAQAILGGLRVILDPQGIAPAAGGISTVFRVLHGCCAQAELCLIVTLAAMLSSFWQEMKPQPAWARISRFAWITVCVIFLQLIVGATMRHLGAGLAIPTFPFTPDGGIMPKVHNPYVDLNFTHTRFGAALVTVFVVALVVKVFRHSGGEPRLQRPALFLCGLLASQIVLGMFVIWKTRPLMLTTIHVVNGAAILATTVLLAVRASHGSRESVDHSPEADLHIREALA